MKGSLIIGALFLLCLGICAQEATDEEVQKILQLEQKIAELEKKLESQGEVDQGDLEEMVRFVQQKEAWEKELQALKEELSGLEKLRRERVLKARKEATVALQQKLREEIKKYNAIVNSKHGQSMKGAAWKALIAICPEWWEASQVDPHDTEQLMLPPEKRAVEPVRRIEYMSVRFFEAGESAPAQDKRQYAKRFRKSSSRYIYSEVYVKNLLFKVEDNSVQIAAKYYKPDGSLFGGPVIKHTIPKEHEYAYMRDGWGWASPGNWTPGQYRVEFFIADKKVGQGYFEIYDDQDVPTVTAQTKTYEYEKLRFFEAGEKAPDQRDYKTSFPKSTARSIYFEVTLKNLLWKIRENPVHIVAKYYKPNGILFGELKMDYTIPKKWDYAEIWKGWGWLTPGHWEPGQYRVELFLDGKKTTEQTFSIYDDTSVSIETPLAKTKTYEYEKLRFFEAGDKAPDQRAYKKQFPKQSTRYIYFEVTLKNLLWKIKDNPVEITGKYYKPDGSLFGSPVLRYTIPKEWDSAELWKAWGWSTPGYWEAGSYRVEIWMDGQKIAEDHFTIQDQSLTIQVDEIVFFEGGYDTPPRNKRHYVSSFPKSTTRYVYFEIRSKNLLWKVKDNPVEITAKYYKPDGSLFGAPVLEYTIPKSWDYADLWKGWGWNDPGNWEPGQYRVEFFMHGRKIDQKYFTIYR